MAPSTAVVLDGLQDKIGAIFDQAQASLANHKKNCVALYKLHVRAADITQSSKDGTASKLVGERAFSDVMVDMVNRVLGVKKGPATADRVVRFIGSYMKFLNEKLAADQAKQSSSSSISPAAEEDDTISSRLVSRLLKWLLQGFLAKNKHIRYRAVSIVSEMISHLGEIDEDTYNALHESLMERVCDKESLIRVPAVIALSKLSGSEDPSEVEDGYSILSVLLDMLCYDPSAEVRRAVLLNIPLVESTLDSVLSRTRDADPIMRKLVFTNVLQARLGHPRQLTIAQREKIVKDGLGDREPSVRVAAGKLVSSWFDIISSGKQKIEVSWAGDDGGVMKAFIAFLSLFDVVGPGEVIAVDALLSVFTTRPDLPDSFAFPELYWQELSPESAVLARAFVEQCITAKNENRLDAATLPVVTAFAFYIQEAYNALLNAIQESENYQLMQDSETGEEGDYLEEQIAKREVVLGELLRMALKLDYMDEIGRRKVFSVIKDMLAHPQLPPGLIERCFDVLKEIMPSERDLIRVVVEIVVELRDPDEENDETTLTADGNQSTVTEITFRKDRSIRRNKERSDMNAEERIDADITDIRCLLLCIAMLERVDGSFEDNSTLEGILADLIIPSVKRKELAMREKALISLGLCCLIAKNMALNSFQLFLSQAQSAPNELKVQVFKVILDLLFMYDQEFFGRSEETTARIAEFLLHTLEAEEFAPAQAVLCSGISKLLLAGIVTDPRILTALALTYVSPLTMDNQELRQCLSYFFPVYCYSSPDNQSRMQSVFMSSMDLLVKMYEELDEDHEMITPYHFGLLMVDWTNPQKAVAVATSKTEHREVHVDLAVDILLALYDSDRSDEDQKVLCQLLGHLNIMPGLDDRSIHMLNILLSHHDAQCPFENPAVQKLFGRFKNRFSKLFVKELQRIDPQLLLDKEMRELYRRIAVELPEDGTDAVIMQSTDQPLGSEQEEVSHKSDNDSSSSEGESSPTPTPKPNKLRSKARVSIAGTKVHPKELDEDHNDSKVSVAYDPSTVASTPKKNGVKRVHTPDSGKLQSPLNKKRSRLKSPVKARRTTKQKQSDDSEKEVLPTKIRSTRTRQTRQSKGKDRVDEAPKEQLPLNYNGDVASTDDLGGYSD